MKTSKYQEILGFGRIMAKVVLGLIICSGNLNFLTMHGRTHFAEIRVVYRALAAPQKVVTVSGDEIRARVSRVVKRSPLLKD